jgi:hypothetical protein
MCGYTGCNNTAQLLSTEAFIENTIDTSWLDGIIAAKGLTAGGAVADTPQLIVGSAALYRALSQFKEANTLVSDTLSKGQQPGLADLKAARFAEVEVTFEGVKYSFKATKVAEDQIRMTFKDSVGVKQFTSRVREQSDGTVSERARSEPSLTERACFCAGSLCFLTGGLAPRASNFRWEEKAHGSLHGPYTFLLASDRCEHDKALKWYGL